MKNISPKSLIKERKRRELTQEEFAQLLGISLRMYCYYESGACGIPEGRKDSIRLRLGWLS